MGLAARQFLSGQEQCFQFFQMLFHRCDIQILLDVLRVTVEGDEFLFIGAEPLQHTRPLIGGQCC